MSYYVTNKTALGDVTDYIDEGSGNVATDAVGDSGERINYGEGAAIREPSSGKGRYDLVSPFALYRIAKRYEVGSRKYVDRNWEKGMPFSRYIDSAERHLNMYKMGMNEEDHLAAACWNLMAIMHHQELGEDEQWDDMPHYCDLIKTKLERKQGE